MLQKIKEMSYGAARYHVLKELDERGYIGQLLLRYDPTLASKMMNFCDWIDKGAIACRNNQLNDIDWNKVNDMPSTLIFLAEKFPFLVLSASELDWTGFLSAWMTIVFEFLTICNCVMERSGPEVRRDLEMIVRDTETTLQPVRTLVEIGVGYMDLIKAGTHLVNEMQKWRQSQPAAIRLSEAYLKAIGVMPKDEGPVGHGPGKDNPPAPECARDRGDNPPPPPPPPPANDGNNPPPPPPPPPQR